MVGRFGLRLLAGCALVFATCAASAQTYQVRITRYVPYGSDPSQVLDICRPIGAPSPMPAFILLHGGGWVEGDKSDPFVSEWCTRLAQKGYIAFNANYRLVSGQQSGAPLPNPNASNTFPAALLDAQLAVRWVRSKAQTYGVDARRVCSMGISVGGYLAAFLGALKTIYPGDVADELSRYSPGVACVSAHSAPADLTDAITGPSNVTEYEAETWFVNAEPTSENWELFEAASPVAHVSRSSAPMSFTHGTQDPLALPIHASTIEEALKASGAPAQVLWYDGAHSFQGLGPQEKNALIEQSVKWALANARWP